MLFNMLFFFNLIFSCVCPAVVYQNRVQYNMQLGVVFLLHWKGQRSRSFLSSNIFMLWLCGCCCRSCQNTFSFFIIWLITWTDLDYQLWLIFHLGECYPFNFWNYKNAISIFFITRIQVNLQDFHVNLQNSMLIYKISMLIYKISMLIYKISMLIYKYNNSLHY